MNRRLSSLLQQQRRTVALLVEHKGMRALLIVCSLTAAVLGAGAMYLLAPESPWRALPSRAEQAAGPPEDEEPQKSSTIVLPRTKWEVAGIRIGKVRRTELSQDVWVTGKVALNEDRVAQIGPLVEGIVREVRVQFGDDVTTGQILAIIDSREVGDAKLKLYERGLAARLAEVNCQWARTIEENTQSLIQALEEGTPVDGIERMFRNKAMGDYRQQLVSSYAQVHKARADYQRLKGLSDQGISAGKEFLAAEATRDAAEATFQAWLEQIKFTSQEKRLAAEQEGEKAKTAESVSAQSLRILGVPDEMIGNSDPATEGEAISHFPIKAPFDGTVTGKDVVLMESVGPSTHLFTIADLSTVWVKTDIYERHLALLGPLKEQTVRFRTASYPGRVFEARVTYTGDIVGEQSRTLPMTALAHNPDRLLKPGMFVEVELPGETVAGVLVVPTSALQEHENHTFVFVHLDGDRFARRDVSVGRLSGGEAEITDGLKEREPVVVRGGFFLKSQMLEGQLVDED